MSVTLGFLRTQWSASTALNSHDISCPNKGLQAGNSLLNFLTGSIKEHVVENLAVTGLIL